MSAHAAKPQPVFKIATRAAWEAACKQGIFPGSQDDRRDGFIHLSTHQQLAGTLAKHFKDQVDLLLIAFDEEALGDDLRWERSRGGDLFPHLYAPLPTAAARAVRSLQLDKNGLPLVPEDIA
jgi:uncharacterized protein (DUF952 family)